VSPRLLSWVAFSVILVFLMGGGAMAMEIKSAAFTNNAEIAKKYTCQGEDISPPLSWSDVPEGTKSLVLINDDPDAPVGIWRHWTVFNMPPTKKGLSEGEGIPARKQLPDGSLQGMTDSGTVGYHGPCPPPGKYHRYFFKLYALDTVLDLAAGATVEDIERAMEGHILEKAEILGRFKR